MIHVMLCKRVEGGPEHEDVFLEAMLHLPFVPTAGMWIYHKDIEHQVTEVEYDHNKELVYAWTFPDPTMLHNDTGCTPQIRAEIWVADGYTVTRKHDD